MNGINDFSKFGPIEKLGYKIYDQSILPELNTVEFDQKPQIFNHKKETPRLIAWINIPKETFQTTKYTYDFKQTIICRFVTIKMIDCKKSIREDWNYWNIDSNKIIFKGYKIHSDYHVGNQE